MASREHVTFVLSAEGDLCGAVVNLMIEVQRHLTAVFGRAVPGCPDHGHALVAACREDRPVWVCPTGDWSCPIGAYQDIFWPFGPDADADDVRRAVSRRLRRHVKWTGRSRLDADDGGWVLAVRPFVRDDSPAAVAALTAAMTDAIALVRLRVTDVYACRTVRTRREATDGPHGHPGADELGTTGIRRRARLRGILRRATAAEDCDVSVEHGTRRTRVRLDFDHTTSDGSPLLLDHTGAPFADDGDSIELGGGFFPTGPVRTDSPLFVAGSIVRPDEPGKTGRDHSG